MVCVGVWGHVYLQELTTRALHILRKLVEMENKKEDSKASVLEWETVGDDPEVLVAQCQCSTSICTAACLCCER